MEPLVSVIIPVYERFQYLPETLLSVKNQTYPSIELIIVDDGSESDVRGFIEEWKKTKVERDLPALYFFQPHSGVSSARNYGFRKSSGELIQFLDSDDILHPEKIEIQVREMMRTNADFVWSPTAEFESDPSFKLNIVTGTSSKDYIREFFYFPYWLTPSGIYKRELVERAGGWNERLKIWEDWEFNIRVSLMASKVVFVDRVLSFARVHSLSKRGFGKTDEGLREILRSADAIIKIAKDNISLLGEEELENIIYSLYLKVFRIALEAGNSEIAEKALSICSSEISSGWRKFKLEWAKRILKFTGSPVTLKVGRMYAKFKKILFPF